MDVVFEERSILSQSALCRVVLGQTAYQSCECSFEEVFFGQNGGVQQWPLDSLLCAMSRQLRSVFWSPVIDNIVE
jgi:hypothetical protein